MTVAYYLRRMGACRDAIDWAEARVGLTDLEIWQACDDPHWLVWLLLYAHTDDRRQVVEALRPIWLARREALLQVWREFDNAVSAAAHWSEEESERLDRQHIEACDRADRNAASMIRHTVAMPTRRDLVRAIERDMRIPDDLPF